MKNKIRVTVWGEFRIEKLNNRIHPIYINGIHEVIAEFLRTENDYIVRTAVLDEVENGLTDEVLKTTDVLIWWGHKAHNEVEDRVVVKIKERVYNGMGLIVLHSGHYSKIFKALMGTSCSLAWRVGNDKEILWNVAPMHQITKGIGDHFEIPIEEMYGEPFEIPTPDELLFISWFSGGEVIRSGCTWYRGRGKVFYFRPGHESFPTYHQPKVQQVIINSVRWSFYDDSLFLN